MPRKSKWYREFEGVMDRLLKPAFYGREDPDIPERFDPEFWRQWTGLPWEWDYRERLQPPATRQDQVELIRQVTGFLGPKAFNVYALIYVLASERVKDGRWVRVDYTALANHAGVSRKIAVKHVKRLRRCHLIRLLECGTHGQGNVYYAPPVTPKLIWNAQVLWHSLSRKERRGLLSRDILKERHT